MMVHLLFLQGVSFCIKNISVSPYNFIILFIAIALPLLFLYFTSSSFTLMIALQYYPFCSTILNKTSDRAALEIGASHQSVGGENLHRNALTFSQSFDKA